MPIITKAVSSPPAHVDVYSIQHYVITFGSNLRKVDWLLLRPSVSSNNKADEKGGNTLHDNYLYKTDLLHFSTTVLHRM